MALRKRRLVSSASVILLACGAASQCNQEACDPWHTNSAFGALANDDAPPQLERTIPVFEAGAQVSHPVLVSGGDPALLVVVATTGNVSFTTVGPGPSAWWSPPGVDDGLQSIQAAVMLDGGPRGATRVVVVTRIGPVLGTVQAWGLDATWTNGRAITVSLAWGPSIVPGRVDGPLLALSSAMAPSTGQGLVVTAGQGGIYTVDAGDGAVTQLLSLAALTCRGVIDAPSLFSGPVLVQPSPPLLAVATRGGCMVGLSIEPHGGHGGVVWAVEPPPALNASTSAMAGPPSVGRGGGGGDTLLFAATVDGWVCCYDYDAGGGPCGGWGGQQCVGLGPSPATGGPPCLPPSSSLAVSPPSPSFHGGAVYAVGCDGFVYEVQAASGEVAVTDRSYAVPAGGGCGLPPSPLLVPDGFGPAWHALVVGSPDGHLVALSVGDAGPTTDDDDYGETDDDGGVTLGVVWRMPLPCGGGAAALSAPTLSLAFPTGQLLVPCGGAVHVVGSARDGDGEPFLDTPTFAGLALGGCLVVVGCGLGYVMVTAQRQQAVDGPALQARFLIRAAFLAEWAQLQRKQAHGLHKNDDSEETRSRGGVGEEWSGGSMESQPMPATSARTPRRQVDGSQPQQLQEPLLLSDFG